MTLTVRIELRTLRPEENAFRKSGKIMISVGLIYLSITVDFVFLVPLCDLNLIKTFTDSIHPSL